MKRLVTRVSRRRFNFEAAAIAAASFSPTSGLLGANPDSQAQPTEGNPQEAANLGLTAEQVRDADAKLANAIRDFGDRLSDEQRQRLRRILPYNEKMLASIRAFHLENGDPPASVLRYFVGSQPRGMNGWLSLREKPIAPPCPRN
jgi:hypothetical protein